MSGIGSNVNTISDILGVTKAFGEATGFSPAIQSLITSDGLSKYPVTKQNYSFDTGKGRFGGRAIQKQQQEENAKELKKTEKEKKLENTIAGEGDDNNEENPPIETRRKDGKPEGDNQWWDWFDKFANPAADGEGGPGSVISQNGMLAHHTSSYAGVKIDASGESGVDFTPEGDNNRAIFDGYVSDIGHQYNPNSIGGDGRQGAGYGHYIGITSVDSKTGNVHNLLPDDHHHL
jgi:hypothetical protein